MSTCTQGTERNTLYDGSEIKWEPWIQTVSGIKFHFSNRNSHEVVIEDIATVLSRMPRWAGHTSKLFTVGQHSVATADLVKELGGDAKEQFLGFAHDFTEAYLCDIPSPVKRMLPQYKDLENILWAKISRRFFGKSTELTELVRHCDGVMLATEARDLFPFEPLDNWVKRCPPPHPVKIIPWGEKTTYKRFMAKYEELRHAISG